MKEYNFGIGKNSYSVLIKEVTDTMIIADVNGQEQCVTIEQINTLSPFLEAGEIAEGQPSYARHSSQIQTVPSPASNNYSGNCRNCTPGIIETPIPGQIISISVKVGERVKKGQKLLTLEAMKLENAITADHDGSIKEIFVAVGEVVSQSQKLIALD